MSSTTAIPTRRLGGDAKDVKVGAIGYGAMMLTWIDDASRPAEEDSFKAIKTAIDHGATFINTGQFYGPPEDPEANLKLLRRFYDKYPEYIDQTFISVKGGLGPQGFQSGFMATVDNLRADLKRIQDALGPKVPIGIYECARVDPNRTIEESIENMRTLQKEGLFKHIGVSEIHPEALRRAIKVAPIAAAEIELSMFQTEPEAFEVVDICKENDIAVIAYSPLGRGLLSGKIRSEEDVKGLSKGWPMFQGENLKNNLKLVDQVTAMAQKKGVTPAQVALAYVMRLSDKVIPIPGSSSTQRTVENIEAANVQLTDDEFKELHDLRSSFNVAGTRYPAHTIDMNWGKGA